MDLIERSFKPVGCKVDFLPVIWIIFMSFSTNPLIVAIFYAHNTAPHYVYTRGRQKSKFRSVLKYLCGFLYNFKMPFHKKAKDLIFADDHFHFLVWKVTERFRSSVACQLLNQVKQRCCSFTPPGVLHGFYSMGQNSLRLSRISISNEISEHI